MKNVGYIILQRIIREPQFAWLWETPYLRRWLDLLMETSFAPHIIEYHGRMIDVSPGQYLTSYRRLGDRWHCSTSTAFRTCEKFVGKGMIRLQTLSGGRTQKWKERATLITVVNWRRYQDLNGHDSEARNARRNATRNDNKHVDNKATRCSQANENVKTDTAPYPPHIESILSLLAGVESFEREAGPADVTELTRLVDSGVEWGQIEARVLKVAERQLLKCAPPDQFSYFVRACSDLTPPDRVLATNVAREASRKREAGTDGAKQQNGPSRAPYSAVPQDEPELGSGFESFRAIAERLNPKGEDDGEEEAV